MHADKKIKIKKGNKQEENGKWEIIKEDEEQDNNNNNSNSGHFTNKGENTALYTIEHQK